MSFSVAELKHDDDDEAFKCLLPLIAIKRRKLIDAHSLAAALVGYVYESGAVKDYVKTVCDANPDEMRVRKYAKSAG